MDVQEKERNTEAEVDKHTKDGFRTKKRLSGESVKDGLLGGDRSGTVTQITLEKDVDEEEVWVVVMPK